ncbi:MULTISPECIES: L-rhamnose mutarotase [Gracilibacillus]|uniref:L-rhamnose mutarotase n=1 Tax=Gracilibacillus thailandensis TaxID=563735 RepID=A0A6N7QTV6_9BACI|nr:MULTISPECIES: L-rhamnose mutarotase [Gracilibacillus]MRI64954.1 L-rhamnose mutarotase [Gracilibacillus thailandensis]
MARYMFIMECKEGSQEEYKKRHQAVHPELLEALKEVGISNYSIFMDGTKLYAYMEVDDYHRAMKELETNPANRKWQAFMSDILAMDEKGDPKMYLIDQEVFHLD